MVSSFFHLKSDKGFTLTELLTVIAIISILSTLIFSNYRAGERNLALQRSANKLSQDIRRAQEMAMSAKWCEVCSPQVVPPGYGINFQTNSTSSILFADLNNNGVFDSGEKIEESFLEKGVKISNLSPSSPLDVTFRPPDPTTNITPSSTSAIITITNNIQTKTIKINKAGLIYVE